MKFAIRHMYARLIILFIWYFKLSLKTDISFRLQSEIWYHFQIVFNVFEFPLHFSIWNLYEAKIIAGDDHFHCMCKVKKNQRYGPNFNRIFVLIWFACLSGSIFFSLLLLQV